MNLDLGEFGFFVEIKSNFHNWRKISKIVFSLIKETKIEVCSGSLKREYWQLINNQQSEKRKKQNQKIIWNCNYERREAGD